MDMARRPEDVKAQFSQWLTSAIARTFGMEDAGSIAEHIRALDSDSDIHAFVSDFFGASDATSAFTEELLKKRRHMLVGSARRKCFAVLRRPHRASPQNELVGEGLTVYQKAAAAAANLDAPEGRTPRTRETPSRKKDSPPRSDDAQQRQAGPKQRKRIAAHRREACSCQGTAHKPVRGFCLDLRCSAMTCPWKHCVLLLLVRRFRTAWTAATLCAKWRASPVCFASQQRDSG